MSATVFNTADGTRRAEVIRLDGRLTVKVTDPRHSLQPGLVLRFIPVQVITQMRTIGGKQQPITLLAPVTLARLHAAGIRQQDLEAWGLVPPPAQAAW